MSTINGIGTLRYDWRAQPDGTAEATLWFVFGFLPILPLRRERLRVVDPGIQQANLVDGAVAVMGHGSGFGSTIQVLDRVPLDAYGVLRTYFLGFVVVPFAAFIGPMLLLLGGMFAMKSFGIDTAKAFNQYAPAFVLGILVWAGVVIARVLDRTAGRHHFNVSDAVQQPIPNPSYLQTTSDRDDVDTVPSMFHRTFGWIMLGLSVLFGVTAVVMLATGDFEAALGGALITILFGGFSREWLAKRVAKKA